jgi:hypothetical protein
LEQARLEGQKETLLPHQQVFGVVAVGVLLLVQFALVMLQLLKA